MPAQAPATASCVSETAAPPRAASAGITTLVETTNESGSSMVRATHQRDNLRSRRTTVQASAGTPTERKRRVGGAEGGGRGVVVSKARVPTVVVLLVICASRSLRRELGTDRGKSPIDHPLLELYGRLVELTQLVYGG